MVHIVFDGFNRFALTTKERMVLYFYLRLRVRNDSPFNAPSVQNCHQFAPLERLEQSIHLVA